MSRKIIKIRSGEFPPENSKFLYSAQERDKANSYRKWIVKDTWNNLPILEMFIGTETLVECTPVTTFHYYEVDATTPNGSGE